MFTDLTSPVNMSDNMLRLLKLVGLSQFNTWLHQQALLKHLAGDYYSPEDIFRATSYYIRPECQSVDHNEVEDIHHILSVRIDLFQEIDRILDSETTFRRTILLADSDMGKSSFALNYYAYHHLSWSRSRQFPLVLVPLGVTDADSRIERIEDKSNKVIILDALDEDIRAIEDYRTRLHELMELCDPFRHVLITCRTHFFEREDEQARESGLISIHVNSDGDSSEYTFYKLYISPFSDRQVRAYLKQRFPFRERHLRRKAESLLKKVPQITARPLLLSHINERLDANVTFEHPHEIYADMVDTWLEREKFYVKDKESLRLFVENVAFDLYCKRKERGSERIPKDELELLAIEFGMPLDSWPISSGSLLVRDDEFNYRFIHRTIMEYLFIRRMISNEDAVQKFLQRDDVLTEHMRYLLRHLVPDAETLRKKPRLVALYLKYIGAGAPDIDKIVGVLPVDERVELFVKIGQIVDPRPGVMQVDEIEFCFVQGGPFWMGTDVSKEEGEHLNNKLDYDYWISRFPITVAQFNMFVEKAKYPPQDRRCLNDAPNQPVRYTTRYDALHFCKWLSERWRKMRFLPNGYIVSLPSEAEWEKAARGGIAVLKRPIITPASHLPSRVDYIKQKATHVRRIYPWGDDLSPDRANYNQTKIQDTSPVGCFPKGASPYGCEEMSGNIWEWTRSLFLDYPYDPADGRENLKKPGAHVLRGGCYAYPADFIRCSDRFCDSPVYRPDLNGFRICICPQELHPSATEE